MTLTDAEHARLLAKLKGTSAVMMRHYMHHRGLAAHSSSTIDEQAARFLEHVSKGKLSTRDVHSFCLDYRESSRKRVFLFKVEEAAEHAALLETMKATQPAHHEDCSLRYAGSPIQSYHFVTDAEARLVYTERHTQAKSDFRTRTWSEQPVEKTIVLSLNRATRVLRIAYDMPERIHPHGDKLDDYYAHFEMEAISKLAIGITPLALEPHIRRLQKKPHVRISKLRSSHPDARITISPQGIGDVRKTAGFADHEKRVIVPLGGEYIWESDKTSARAEGAPMRDIRASVDGVENSVTFQQHTLGAEIDYVLAHLVA
jgi:hypothetical protein